ncbi:MAG: hypothetical protein V3R27_09850 [Pseudomonadales bacterium]
MKVIKLASSLAVVGLVFAGGAYADDKPYASWWTKSTDDHSVSYEDSFNRSTEDSFNRQSSYSKTEDNDVAITRTSSEDNDTTIDRSIADSFNRQSSYSKSEDNDFTSIFKRTTDIDVITPTLTSLKKQDVSAGHTAGNAYVSGAANGHVSDVQGSKNLVSAGNKETNYWGPAMVNTNVNQIPTNHLYIQGSNVGSPISQGIESVAGDKGNYGVFGSPIGNTQSWVGGDVSNASGAAYDQSGDSSSSIADTMSSSVQQ